MKNFFGRTQELIELRGLLRKNSASFVVIKGRRRIGKSRLVAEFGNNSKFYNFSGVPPTEDTSRLDQIHEFGWQLAKILGEPPFKDDDWNDVFLRLANCTRQGTVIILFDEISWMGSKDPNFLGKLKNAWDLEFKKNNKLILIVCGSVSSWIERNILNHTGFLGRISLNMTLNELSLSESNEFWDGKQANISSLEKYKILSLTGGVPKYLEEIRTELPAEENIKNLCFTPSGLLFNEFEHIFADIFSRRSEIYKKIVQTIADNSFELDKICKQLGVEKNGVMSGYLEDLVLSGFISKDNTWMIASGKQSKLGKYRIKDNYLRFYLKYILPNKDQIIRGAFVSRSLGSLPNWDGIMGLQFENMVVNNRKLILDVLQIRAEDVVYDNPFFQTKTKSHDGCQIDYMIQTRFNTLYLCEIKFSRHAIGLQVVDDIKSKIAALKIPKLFSVRAVLLHVCGVSDEVIDSRYFADIIDFALLLAPQGQKKRK